MAGMSCDVRSDGVEEYATFQFLDPDDLDGYYAGRLAGISMGYDAGGYCPSDRSEEGWEHGRVVCWVSRTGTRLAHIRWTDDRTGTYGLLDASNRDLENLYGWWLAYR